MTTVQLIGAVCLAYSVITLLVAASSTVKPPSKTLHCANVDCAQGGSSAQLH